MTLPRRTMSIDRLLFCALVATVSTIAVILRAL